ncbi:unnamed protein product [Chrysodeixis includens]|uniref:Peptidase S1 domain-containing protein n=1 Tax=Chrysodeixis includens TaxID=689277 RepID=A0A9P0C2X4_CHRIL|nr:unnamed protein product [Chrysodeixis includens]
MQIMSSFIRKIICLLFVLKVHLVNGKDKYEFLNLTDGSPCSWQGVDGVCTTTYKCLSAMEDIRKHDYPPICGFQGVKPIICCTDCELKDLTDESYRINPNVPTWFYKTGKPANDQCLDYLDALGTNCEPGSIYKYVKEKHETKNCFTVYPTEVAVAGGDDADRAQFRHMALLGYGPNVDSAQWICGGSLISEKFILTAGHCVSSPGLGPVRYVALGILKRSDPLELWQRYLVKRIVRHPQYKPPSKYHDIALLESEELITFNTYVFPACLQFQSYPDLDDLVTATGWGALGRNRGLADTLQAVEIHRYEPHECSRLYPRHRHLQYGVNDTTQTCYGDRKKISDTCQGDSGGPIQNIYYISECVYTILGVTSAGRSCGFSGSSGIYTRVLPALADRQTDMTNL